MDKKLQQQVMKMFQKLQQELFIQAIKDMPERQQPNAILMKWTYPPDRHPHYSLLVNERRLRNALKQEGYQVITYGTYNLKAQHHETLLKQITNKPQPRYRRVDLRQRKAIFNYCRNGYRLITFGPPAQMKQMQQQLTRGTYYHKNTKSHRQKIRNPH